MTFNFLGPGLTVNVEAKVKEQIILDSSGKFHNDGGNFHKRRGLYYFLLEACGRTNLFRA